MSCITIFQGWELTLSGPFGSRDTAPRSWRRIGSSSKPDGRTMHLDQSHFSEKENEAGTDVFYNVAQYVKTTLKHEVGRESDRVHA